MSDIIVCYILPGSHEPVLETHKVDKCDPDHDAKGAPEEAFAFYYMGCDSDMIFLIDAEVLSKDEVQSSVEDWTRIVLTMTSNGWTQVARTRFGEFLPFNPNQQEVVSTV